MLNARATTVHISARDLFTRSNYQEFGRYQQVDVLVPGDMEATLPDQIEACHRLVTAASASATAARVLVPMQLPYEAYRALVRRPGGSTPAYSEAVFPEQAVTYAYLRSLPASASRDERLGLLAAVSPPMRQGGNAQCKKRSRS